MSSAQRPSRRLSARIQGKDGQVDVETAGERSKLQNDTSKKMANATTNARKRKNEHEEDDDGFTFSRVKKRKQAATQPQTQPEPISHSREPQSTSYMPQTTTVPLKSGETATAPKRRRNKMSFSTPNPKELQPIRRSKRLSNENNIQEDGSPKLKPRQKEKKPIHPTETEPVQTDAIKTKVLEQQPLRAQPQLQQTLSPQPKHQSEIALGEPVEAELTTAPAYSDGSLGTKIALPFADTPVIRRNKAMREGKGGNGERRSSLGFRGRRASSLIESGNSNALPHNEVSIPDFYKHIECESLPEPRRMRQLLTWCATRALDQKPMGTSFEDASARSAARVIEEELLKDLANKSEMSDWFTREDVPVEPKVLPERPNPKNIQNAEKILELEEQIQKLRAEKESLESLTRPSAIPTPPTSSLSDLAHLDITLLSESDSISFTTIKGGSEIPIDVSRRLNQIYSSLGPTVDAFADGLHKIGQYRIAADQVAGRVLGICSTKLADRDKVERKQALQPESDATPRRDLGNVLRGLSRADR